MMPARGMKQDANSNEERHADIENTDKYDKLPNMPNENESESIIKVRVVETQSGETYVIFLNSVITPVGATVHTLRVQLIYISGIMILLKNLQKVILKWNLTAKIIGRLRSFQILLIIRQKNYLKVMCFRKNYLQMSHTI